MQSYENNRKDPTLSEYWGTRDQQCTSQPSIFNEVQHNQLPAICGQIIHVVVYLCYKYRHIQAQVQKQHR